MYAVFSDKTRQFRVSEGEIVELDYRKDQTPGGRLVFESVMLVNGNEGLQLGKPFVSGARVVGEVVEHSSVKQYIQKFRRRKNYRRYTEHRQPFTRVRISHILLAGQELPPQAPPPAPIPAPTPAPTPA